jgi:hypothetical protein
MSGAATKSRRSDTLYLPKQDLQPTKADTDPHCFNLSKGDTILCNLGKFSSHDWKNHFLSDDNSVADCCQTAVLLRPSLTTCSMPKTQATAMLAARHQWMICPWYGKVMTVCARLVQKQRLAPSRNMTALPYT